MTKCESLFILPASYLFFCLFLCSCLLISVSITKMTTRSFLGERYQMGRIVIYAFLVMRHEKTLLHCYIVF